MFSLTVVGVLTLGIGLNAAVFSVLKGLALRPLAGVEGSSRLVSLFRETSLGRPLRVSYPDYQYLRDNERASGRDRLRIETMFCWRSPIRIGGSSVRIDDW